MRKDEILSVASLFDTDGAPEDAEPFGSGHINDTYAVKTARRRYVLQRLNTSIFAAPEQLMDNLLMVTDHLRRKIITDGGDPERETLTPVLARGGAAFVRDDNGEFWRMTALIENSFSLDRVDAPRDLCEAGRGFGRFMRMLSDFPADRLHETIPNFHNTPRRLEALRHSVEADACGRLDSAKSEVEGYLSRAEAYSEQYERAMRELPLRVTHNDTKINNILFDSSTRRALSVVDLDTVMPGLAAFDFGDAIRTGAATADEDTQNPETMGVSVELFSAYARGYLDGLGPISAAERDALTFGAKLMTYECGARFLADWLDGDTYFKTSRPMHNLERARAQLALLEDMERRSDELEHAIISAERRNRANGAVEKALS